MTGLSAARRELAVTLAWRPEWPVVVVVAMAWVALLAIHASPAGAGAHAGHADIASPTTVGAAVGGWALMSWALMSWALSSWALSSWALLSWALLSWTLMSVAMMVPVTLPAVRHVGLNSIRRRRHRATGIYVASYVAVWVVFGAVALLLVAALRASGADELVLVAGALVVAVLWQLTRWKRRAIIACQRTVPLPPTGWRADYGCVRFGLRQSGRCIVSCWPLMLLMAVIGHTTLLVMAALTIGIVAERRIPVRGHFAVPVAGALAATTVWAVLFG